MEYQEVDKNQQQAILKGRLAGWEGDHLGHTLNLAAGQAAGDQATIEASQDAIRVLEASIEAGRQLLKDKENDYTQTTTD